LILARRGFISRSIADKPDNAFTLTGGYAGILYFFQFENQSQMNKFWTDTTGMINC